MTFEIPDYPYGFFPENTLPDKVIDMAQLAVRSTCMESGRYRMALLLRGDSYKASVVIQPREIFDGFVEFCVKDMKDKGCTDAHARFIDPSEGPAVHQQAMDELELMVAQLERTRKPL